MRQGGGERQPPLLTARQPVRVGRAEMAEPEDVEHGADVDARRSTTSPVRPISAATSVVTNPSSGSCGTQPTSRASSTAAPTGRGPG